MMSFFPTVQEKLAGQLEVGKYFNVATKNITIQQTE
jgi:hypothetical protein